MRLSVHPELEEIEFFTRAPEVLNTLIWLLVPFAGVDELAGDWRACRAHRDADRRTAARQLERLHEALAVGAVQLQDAAVAVVGDVHIACGIDARIAGLLELRKPGGVDAAGRRAAF